MNSDDIQKELTELTRNAKDPVIPKVFDNERLEDAFKVPIMMKMVMLKAFLLFMAHMATVNILME